MVVGTFQPKRGYRKKFHLLIRASVIIVVVGGRRASISNLKDFFVVVVIGGGGSRNAKNGGRALRFLGLKGFMVEGRR
jgi:hypothetical protein